LKWGRSANPAAITIQIEVNMSFHQGIRKAFVSEFQYGSMLYFKGESEPRGAKNPHYIHYILKAMERGMTSQRITCVVFPKKGPAAHVAWVTLAIDTLASKVLRAKARETSEAKLQELNIGDFVETYPGNKVFIWGGEISDNGNKVLIFKVIGKEKDQIGLPVSTFSPLRIKKYPGTKPPAKQTGKLRDLSDDPPSSGMDILMPLKTYGNKGLTGVCACLISDRGSITDFLKNTRISLHPSGPFTTIGESILEKDAQDLSPEQCTCLHSTDLDNALETLRSASNLPLGQRTPLIIDGLSHIRDIKYLNELRYTEDNVQRPIVVVAESSERMHIERLADNFDFWELHNTEIQSE
jgi:hypothetical protein